ncbi:MAG TPA: alpha-N-arabinofuranosidase, partial [Cyclobacteriaceae bacterium]
MKNSIQIYAIQLLSVILLLQGYEQEAKAQLQKSTAQPLVSHIYTADPSAHVFNNKIYIYPSHDIEAGTPENDNGDHFDMRDYHILSMDSIGGKVTDHGVALDIKNIPWAGRQLWAPDAAFANNMYYLY